MAHVSSFEPVAEHDARVLLLGSMPGNASLQAHRYYAHPRNAFWPIVGSLLGFDPETPYELRLQHLCAGGMALWDVLARCSREGSLDASIRSDTMVTNDFAGFLRRHPQVHVVACNGGTAHRLFTKRVVPTLPRELRVVSLPSTSPAHARMSFAEKSALWHGSLRPWLR